MMVPSFSSMLPLLLLLLLQSLLLLLISQPLFCGTLRDMEACSLIRLSNLSFFICNSSHVQSSHSQCLSSGS